MYHTFIHSSGDGHLSGFHVLTTVNPSPCYSYYICCKPQNILLILLEIENCIFMVNYHFKK